MKKVQSRTNLSIDIHAYNLRTPTHMEWTTNGRLIVSEHTSGTIKDITEGEPHKGTIVAIDPNIQKDYRFEIPVIQGLTMPSCLRFNKDGSEMYICSMASGIIWKVTGF
ncbi:hypothetical protein ACFFIS_14400 [Virgibacillus soli]|uniref:hypothetical protein n=1 Tax=Paracerasibacillus soli TaxID=480284 RepID=UPI0035EDF352